MATLSTETQIASFNRQLLQCQEEAYTLAYYLIGSAEAAAQTVQAAVLQAFERITSAGVQRAADRLQLLRLVIECCKKRHETLRAARAESNDPLAGKFLSLPPEERSAVLLVDVLGLSYVEAAQVLGTNTARVSQRLAHGRMLTMGL